MTPAAASGSAAVQERRPTLTFDFQGRAHPAPPTPPPRPQGLKAAVLAWLDALLDA